MSRVKPQKNAIAHIPVKRDVPEGWSLSTVGECFFDIRNGTTASQNKQKRGVPVSRIETIQDARFDLGRLRHIEKASAELLNVFAYKTGDIALSHINSFEHVGKTAIYEGKPKSLIHGMNLLRLRLGHEHLFPKYLYLFMQTDYFRWQVRDRVLHAVNQVSINQRSLSQVSVLLTPLREQKRIVAKVEQLLARVNAARERLAKIPAILKRFRQSVLAAACSGRLTADWRENNTSVTSSELSIREILRLHQKQWVHEKGSAKKYKQPKSVRTERLPDVPESWKRVSSDALFSFVTSGSRGWAKYYSESGSTFIRIGNLDHDTITLDLSQIKRVNPPRGAERQRTRVQPGDILVSITADVGMTALVPDGIGEAYVNQHVAIARPVAGVYQPWLAWYLASAKGGQAQFQNLQRGATKIGLGLDDIRSVTVPFPPVEEQKEIAKRIEIFFKMADAIEKRVTAATAQAEKLTQAILAKAFRGELVFTEAELARLEGRLCEPASALLAKIKAQMKDVKPQRNRGRL